MALETIDNPGIDWQAHKVMVSGLCPRTGNPQVGSYVVISYAPANKVLEVYSLTDYIESFAGSQEVRDLEQLVKAVADDCSRALEVRVTVWGEFVLDIDQTVTIRASGNAN